MCAEVLTKTSAAHTGVCPDLHELAHCLDGLCCLRCQLSRGRQDETLRPAPNECQTPFHKCQRLLLVRPGTEAMLYSQYSVHVVSVYLLLEKGCETHSKTWESRSCSRDTAIMEVFPVPDCAWAITSLP